MGLFVSQPTQQPTQQTEVMTKFGKNFYLLKNVYDTKGNSVQNLWGSPITIMDIGINIEKYPNDAVIGFELFLSDGTVFSSIEQACFTYNRYVYFDPNSGHIFDYQTRKIKYKFVFYPHARLNLTLLDFTIC
jgi:hypothetical protein